MTVAGSETLYHAAGTNAGDEITLPLTYTKEEEIIEHVLSSTVAAWLATSSKDPKAHHIGRYSTAPTGFCVAREGPSILRQPTPKHAKVRPYLKMAVKLVLAALVVIYSALQSYFQPNFIVHKSGAILLTGASSGIGYDAAKALADRGYTVFGTVRNENDFETLKVSSCDCDHTTTDSLMYFGQKKRDACER